MLARLLAGTTRLGTDSTVSMVRRMALAFNGAQLTRKHARLELTAQQLELGLLLTGQDAGGCDADVATILIQSNAATEHRDLLLAEARVRARVASLRAIETCVDACGEALDGHDVGRWIGFDELRGVHVSLARNACARSHTAISAS